MCRLVYLLLFCSITFPNFSVYGQQVTFRCGIDSVRQPPNYDSFSPNRQSGFYPKAAQEDTATYRIPVVFIIYHLGEPQGTGSNISDESVGYVLNLINERFAGIGVNGYRGQDSKIRFLLAKRTQRCNATSGIIRVDGRSVPSYEANGNTEYNIQQQLAALVPDFFDQSTRSGVLVINLYHRVGGGAFAYYGGAVHMTVPGEVDLNPYNYVPTHEVGHSLHLFHPMKDRISRATSIPARLIRTMIWWRIPSRPGIRILIMPVIRMPGNSSTPVPDCRLVRNSVT